VVDNASTDDSMVVLERLYPQVRCLRNPLNEGFATACNQGARLSASEYILFLNPDAEISQGTLPSVLAHMQAPESAKIGVCGIALRDDDGHRAQSCARLFTFRHLLSMATGLNHFFPARFPGVHLLEWDHLDTREVEHVIGAFYFIRRKVFEAIGGFDDQFFLYYEDLDLSNRVLQSGWQIRYLANLEAHHIGGGTSKSVKARRLFFSLRSRTLYSLKHFPRYQALAVLPLTLIVEPAARSMNALVHGSWDELKETWNAFRLLYRDIPRWLRSEWRSR